jgi:hypothetical protein
MAGVLEYLTAEVLELAGDATREFKKVRIQPRYIVLSIRQDDELDLLLSGVTIPGGGVQPHIEKALLPLSSGAKARMNEAGPSNAAKPPIEAKTAGESKGGGSKAGGGSKSTETLKTTAAVGSAKGNFRKPNTVATSKAGGASKEKEPEPTQTTRANSRTRSESRAPSEDIGRKRKNAGKP